MLDQDSATAAATAPTPSVTTTPRYLDQAGIEMISRQLRGIATAQLRFHECERGFEEEVVALLIALGITAEAEQSLSIAPPPRCRFSFRFKGPHAGITASQACPLHG